MKTENLLDEKLDQTKVEHEDRIFDSFLDKFYLEIQSEAPVLAKPVP